MKRTLLFLTLMVFGLTVQSQNLPSGDFTVSARICTTASSPNTVQNILSTGTDERHFNLRIVTSWTDAGGKDLIQVLCGKGNGDITTTDYSLKNKWVTLTVVKSKDIVYLFVDGKRHPTPAKITYWDNGQPLIVGRFPLPIGYRFVGSIEGVTLNGSPLNQSYAQSPTIRQQSPGSLPRQLPSQYGQPPVRFQNGRRMPPNYSQQNNQVVIVTPSTPAPARGKNTFTEYSNDGRDGFTMDVTGKSPEEVKKLRDEYFERKKKDELERIRLESEKNLALERERATNELRILTETARIESEKKEAARIEAENLEKLEQERVAAIEQKRKEEQYQKDRKLYLFYRNQADDKKLPTSMFMTGQMLLEGRGCETNKTLGMTYIKQAADAGSSDAKTFLQNLEYK